ncbi:YIP1 family protein [Paenibacillus sp. CN-4]|uniref:YIP1 family protein n=1 Tax=Paenibacillus nanchangensis TaxID=3348343 RepID=UPI00397A7DC4
MNREALQAPFHVMVHPFNGYWDLKYERSQKTNLILSFIILFLMIFTNVLSSQYSGFLVNYNNPAHLNSLLEVVYVTVPVFYWCVANWSLTTLMDGEGKFSEIFITTCFALVPIVLINLPWIWLSNFVSLQESTFYYFFKNLAVLWAGLLLFVGTMTVHQFTPLKTVGTLLLTVVAVGFMAFLTLLFFSLIQQIVMFFSTIYQEMVLRR